MGISFTPATLPSKFLPSLLGNPSCKAPHKNMIDALFAKGLQSIKSGYILDGERWIIKGRRNDHLKEAIAADAHLYRVRKAKKIQDYITKEGLAAHVVVPEKHLYWDKKTKEFYAVCQKLDLDDCVVKPTAEYEIAFKLASYLGGQIEAFSKGAKQKALSPEQARILAECSFRHGLTDLTYNNLFFTKDGKIAILDTEPIKRKMKKMTKASWFFYLFGEIGAVKQWQALSGTAKLKGSCVDLNAKEAIRKVEISHVRWGVAKLVAKLAVAIFLVVAALPALTALQVTGLAFTAVNISLKIVLGIKIVILALNILSTIHLYRLSCKGDIATIAQLEQQGAC